MNVLLVYPQYPDTFWSFEHVLKFISKKVAYPPLGLLTVASMLPSTWKKKLVDTNVRDLKDEDIGWADVVFISAMLIQKSSAQEIIRRCKAQSKIVVAGGPAFTTQPELYDGVDHFVLNEAEVTLPLFLADFERGKAARMYASTERPDITHTPIPDWSLIKFKEYATMSVQYSRGCPYNCEFCDIIVLNGRTPRTKTPEQMLREMQALYDHGWRGTVFIVDDNFIGNKTHVKAMLPALIEWQKQRRYPFMFFTEASVNLADDKELMQLMAKANFHKVFVGIETPNEDSLKECGKAQNSSRNLSDAVKVIQRHGMQVMGGFIVGFDNDPETIFERQIEFIQKTGIVTAMVGLLNALPETRLWKRLKEEKRLESETTGENTDGFVNFKPLMGRKKLIEGYQKILNTIYSPKPYYKRLDTFLKNYKMTVKGRVTFTDVRAFLRTFWSIGVVSRARFHYWKMIAKTSLIRIRALPIAIELAIYLLHFEKVAKRVAAVPRA